MIDYGTDVGNVNGILGNYTAKNASGATATDGTPYVASVIDDIWGPKQALMDLAGLTPNGVTESVSASQILEAMRKGYALGAGYIVQYDKAALPAVNGDRVLLLTGQGVLVATYADLTNAMYVGDANNAAVAAAGGAYYRADDAAGTLPNITGAYLILPDYRGVVPRGLDVAGSIDPQGAARFVGDLQQDAFQNWQVGAKNDNSGAKDYWGIVQTRNVGNSVQALANRADVAYGDNTSSFQGSANALVPMDDGTNGTPRTSTETRMYNVSTTFGITY
jgi:hypothetical protein